MRVLVICNAAHGHLYPLVPVVRALMAAGHDALVAVPGEFVDVVRALGLPAHGVISQETSAAWKHERKREQEQLPPSERPRAQIATFIAIAEAGLRELDERCASFAPDVILRELTAFAGWLLGARREIPVVVFDFFPLPVELWAAVAGEGLREARRRGGLAPEPALESLHGAVTLLSGPPSWFAYRPPGAVLIRPGDVAREGDETPPWLHTLPQPIVYATLGTTFHQEPGLWERSSRMCGGRGPSEAGSTSAPSVATGPGTGCRRRP